MQYSYDLLAVTGSVPVMTITVVLVSFSPVNVAIPQKRTLPMPSLTVVDDVFSEVVLRPRLPGLRTLTSK